MLRCKKRRKKKFSLGTFFWHLLWRRRKKREVFFDKISCFWHEIDNLLFDQRWDLNLPSSFLKEALFFEAAGAVSKIDSSLHSPFTKLNLNIFFKNVIQIVFNIDLCIVQIPCQNCWLPDDAFFIRWNTLQENKHLNIYNVLFAVFCLFFHQVKSRQVFQDFQHINIKFES